MDHTKGSFSCFEELQLLSRDAQSLKQTVSRYFCVQAVDKIQITGQHSKEGITEKMLQTYCKLRWSTAWWTTPSQFVVSPSPLLYWHSNYLLFQGLVERGMVEIWKCFKIGWSNMK